MNDFPRYSLIRKKIHEALQAKNGWGKNEVESLINVVLQEVADAEIDWLRQRLREQAE